MAANHLTPQIRAGGTSSKVLAAVVGRAEQSGQGLRALEVDDLARIFGCEQVQQSAQTDRSGAPARCDATHDVSVKTLVAQIDIQIDT